MVCAIKTNSSRWLRMRPDLSLGFAWQNGYSAFSVSRSRLQAVARYIENQEIHHARVSSEMELDQLTKLHDLVAPNPPVLNALEGHR
jgi:hypothetical protein